MRIIPLALVFFVSGCTFAENYVDLLTEQSGIRLFISDEQRIVKYHKQCIELGVEDETTEMEDCIVDKFERSKEAFLNRIGGSSSKSKTRSQQILEHGKGGCLPDFSTGGCF